MQRSTLLQSAAVFVVTLGTGLPFALQLGQWLAGPADAGPPLPGPTVYVSVEPDATPSRDDDGRPGGPLTTYTEETRPPSTSPAPIRRPERYVPGVPVPLPVPPTATVEPTPTPAPTPTPTAQGSPPPTDGPVTGSDWPARWAG
jgi:hypothetical protein